MTSAAITAPSGIGYPVWVAGVGPPLVLLHGFTGSHETWQHLVAQLSESHRVASLDLPGHGISDTHDKQTWTFTNVVDDLAWLIESQLGGSADVLGYSMGGRLALALAVTHPARVRNLILESASPGIADSQERRARQLADEQLAERILTGGLEAFVAHWEGLPMWESQAGLPASDRLRLRQLRLEQNPAGLASNLRATGTGKQPAYWDRLAGLMTPALLIAGGLDTKFAHIATSMHEALPQSRLEIVANAGHAVHLERPTRYIELVSDFLDQFALSATETKRSERD